MLDKIIEIQDFKELKQRTYVVLAHLWLHKKAEEENLFDAEEWSDSESRDYLIKKIELFLNRNIQ
ncbi:MAG: hypothetical protein ACFFBF_10070 [Promethearchaeota archaeon]